jgi:N-acetylmuramoyl-L-alanine amidase CwlA
VIEMEIIQAYQTKNRCYQTARKAKHIGILVHSTGAVNKTLKRYVDSPERLGVNKNKNTWNNAETDKCMHAFIGYDKNNKVIVAQTLPYEYACWGCGSGKKGSYNRDPVAHIQFEICQGSNTDKAYYNEAVKAAEEYCAYLCKKYGWTSKNIVSHQEAAKRGYASNHSDPESWMKYFGDDMDKFRARVEARLNGSKKPVDEPKVEVKESIKDEHKEAQKGDYAVYTVQKNDTLWKIATKQLGKGSRYTEIKTLNGLKSDKILPGQTLKIPKNR